VRHRLGDRLIDKIFKMMYIVYNPKKEESLHGYATTLNHQREKCSSSLVQKYQQITSPTLILKAKKIERLGRQGS
jgi:hypothetical protein